MVDRSSKKEIKRRNSAQFRTARMLAIVLDEPGDNPAEPGDVRMEQARRLLQSWSSAQSAVTGMLREVINLKRGYCVRCVGDPCPDCGSDSTKIEPL